MEFIGPIIEAFNAGGFTLVLVLVLISGIIYIGKNMMKKMKEMGDKIDTMKEEITEIKLQNEKYITAIKFCDKPDCKLKTLIER